MLKKAEQQISPLGTESLHVWENNPITKPNSRKSTSNTDSENDLEKETQHQLKTRTSPENSPIDYHGKQSRKNGKQRGKTKNVRKNSKQNGQKEDNKVKSSYQFMGWPQGKLDANNTKGINGDKDRELCSKVEHLLKEMLLKKDETTKKRIPINKSVSVNEGSVSPELQENDSWYTQPIEVLFSSEEPRQRLYKRNSYPLFTSTSSSPVHDEFDEEQEVLLEDNLTNLRESIATEDEDEIFEKSSGDEEALKADLLTYDGFSRDLAGEKLTSPISIPQQQSNIQNFKSSGDDVKDSFSTPYDNIFVDFDNISGSSDSQASIIESTPLPVGHEREVASPAPAESSLLDRNYLFSFQNDLETVECPYLSLMSPEDFSLMGFPEAEDSTWPSKVLFADFVLPYDWIWKDVEIGYSAEFYERLKSGNLSQVWDVNYQKIKGTYLPYKSSIWTPAEYTDDVWLFAESVENIVSSSRIDQDHFTQGEDNTENTLIPLITFDLASEAGSEYDNLAYDIENDQLGWGGEEFGNETEESYADFQLLWHLAEQHAAAHLVMSRSFELVPSERSAFVDAIPRKMHHVQSEPNLKFCSQERDEFKSPVRDRKSKSDSQTPDEEHLYFSPKTHFRPIQTPVSQDSMTDLFGGYASSKTPYQKYVDNGSTSDAEDFVPMFKIRKDLDKYIQTGSSLEDHVCTKLENDEESTCQVEPGIIQEGGSRDPYVVEEFDIFGYIDSLTASAANTPQNVQENQCTNWDSGYEDTDGEVAVEKSTARSEARQVVQGTVGITQPNAWQEKLRMAGGEESENAEMSCSCPVQYDVDAEYGGCGESYSDVFLCETEPPVHHWMISQAWGLDPGSVRSEPDGSMKHSIWSSSDGDMPFSEMFRISEHDDDEQVPYLEQKENGLESQSSLEYGQSYSELNSYLLDHINTGNTQGIISRKTSSGEEGKITLVDKENFPPSEDGGDVVKVKLVIRKGRTKRDLEEENTEVSSKS